MRISPHVEREGLILMVWVLPGDTGGGGDEQQDWSNGGEFPWFKLIFRAL